MENKSKQTVPFDSKGVKVIAHRGLSGIECENTAASFIAAGNRNYFGIETDVHKTSDGKFIVIHDDDTARVADVNLSVEGTDFATLRSLTLHEKNGETRADLKLPSLREYLRICRRYSKKCVLELKNRIPTDDIKRVITIINEEYTIDEIIFISFSYDNLSDLRTFLPNAHLQLLIDAVVDDELIEKMKKYNLNLDIYYEKLNKENIKRLHENGILVNCWTCDDTTHAAELIDWGVDFITTDILQAK